MQKELFLREKVQEREYKMNPIHIRRLLLLVLLACVLPLGINQADAKGTTSSKAELFHSSEDGLGINEVIKYGVNDQMDQDINVDGIDLYMQEDDVPDVYGTSPETTFTFEVNGQVLQPGEAIYIESGPGQTSYREYGLENSELFWTMNIPLTTEI